MLALESLLHCHFLRSLNVLKLFRDNKAGSDIEISRPSFKVFVSYSAILSQLAQFLINDHNHTESYKHGKIFLYVEFRLFKPIIFVQ